MFFLKSKVKLDALLSSICKMRLLPVNVKFLQTSDDFIDDFILSNSYQVSYFFIQKSFEPPNRHYDTNKNAVKHTVNFSNKASIDIFFYELENDG